MNKNKKYSEEVSQIMNTIPSFTIRWGISVLAIITLLVLSGSYFIKYPEVISMDIKLIKAEDVNFTGYLSLKSYSDSAAYIAVCPIPEVFLGKVKAGQVVNVKLKAYPYQEYGLLRGRIDSIFFDSLADNQMVIISMPDGLVTLYKKNIKFHKGMSGVAEIITHKRRIIDPLLDAIRSFYRNNITNK
ncbi:MAG: hypothetical protein LBK47_02470 [Prevotellaceae bacterium]|jgi:hypothetical protein|nr:hypothetical protein [Prevotellaceae bacterium]